MVRVDYYLFGYRIIEVKPELLHSFSSVLIRHGICATVGIDEKIIIKETAYKLIKDKISDFTLSVSDERGLKCTLLGVKSHPFVILALILNLFIYAFSADMIYEIRVTGNSAVRREVIIEELDTAGLSVGTKWSSVDRDSVEGLLLAKSDTVSWISINRVGNVAYVSVIEKFSEQEKNEDKGYSNVVARADGIIEEIHVSRGYAAVKVGDAVKKGDLLISGILPDELGGGICHAEGVVLARAFEELSVSVSENEEKKVYGESSLFEVSLKIFNFSLNIFKKYGNIDSSCDIIEDVEDFVLFGKYRMPLSLCKKYVRKTDTVMSEYTKEEQVRLAVYRMQRLRTTLLSDKDLVAIKTEGEFIAEAYVLTCKMTVITDIGENRRITDYN